MQIRPLFLSSFLCFFPIEVKSLQAGETCVGIRRSDSSFDFKLPDPVAVNVQDENCDAVWTINQEYTAVLDGKSIYSDHHFKNVTRHGISIFYCPTSLTFHVSCPKYVNDLACSCVNYTNSNLFLSTTMPSPDISSSSFNDKQTSSSMRKRYATIAAVAALILVILGFFICRKNGSSTDEDKQPSSVEVT